MILSKTSQLGTIRASIVTPLMWFLLLGATALTISACCSEDPYSPTRPPIGSDSSRQAFLRFVIVDPALQDVEILLDSEPVFCQPLGYVAYPDTIYEAQFWPVDTAATTLSFVRPSGEVLATTQIELSRNSYHTAYLYAEDSGPGHDIIVTTDDPKNVPSSSQARYRLVNFAENAPAVDISFIDNKNPGDVQTIKNLGYGDTTEFKVQSTGSLPDAKRLVVTESATGDTIVSIARVILFGESINTLVMLGTTAPKGDDKFIYFSVFQDNRAVANPKSYCGESVPLLAGVSLYGGLPLALEISAVRFINATNSNLQGLDVTLKDVNFGNDWPDNFRRNFPGQEAVIDVSALGSDPARARRGYFFLSTILGSSYPYRVEVHTAPSNSTEAQPVLVPEKEFEIQQSRRYTIIAFGPNTAGQAGSVTIFDRTPAPPAGQVGLRFFHGAYQSLSTSQLRIRVNGGQSKLMGYGESPDPATASFSAPASGSSTIEVVDASGTVVHTQNGVNLEGDKTYLLILSRGADGTGLIVTAIDEEVVKR